MAVWAMAPLAATRAAASTPRRANRWKRRDMEELLGGVVKSGHCGVVVFARTCARLAVSEGMRKQQARVGMQRAAAGHRLHQQLDAVAADVAVGLCDGG